MSTITELVFWNETANRSSSSKRSIAQAIASSALIPRPRRIGRVDDSPPIVGSSGAVAVAPWLGGVGGRALD